MSQKTVGKKDQPPKKKAGPNFWQRYKKDVQDEANAKSDAKPAAAEPDELTAEERDMIAQRRKQKEEQARAKQDGAGNDAKKTFINPKPVPGAGDLVFYLPPVFVFVNDRFFKILSLVPLVVVLIAISGFQNLISLFMAIVENGIVSLISLVILALAIWLDLRYWRGNRLILKASRGVVSREAFDASIWGRLQSKPDSKDILNVSEILVDNDFFLGLVGLGFIEFIAYNSGGEKTTFRMILQNPEMVKGLFYQMSSDVLEPEELRKRYNAWAENRALIVRFVRWLFGLVRSSTKTKHVTTQKQAHKGKPGVERMQEEPIGEFVEATREGKFTEVRWYAIFGRPEENVTSCGLLNCKSYIGWGVSGKLIPGVVINIPDKGERVWYFHSLEHFELIQHQLRNQRFPKLKWLNLPSNFRFKFLDPQHA